MLTASGPILRPGCASAKRASASGHRLELRLELREVAAMVAGQRADDAGLAARGRELDAAAQEHRRGEGRAASADREGPASVTRRVYNRCGICARRFR